MRMAKSLWDYVGQEQELVDTARRFPRQPSEGTVAYIRRLALEAGLTKDSEGVKRVPAVEPSTDRTWNEGLNDARQSEARLPYRDGPDREPGSDDE